MTVRRISKEQYEARLMAFGDDELFLRYVAQHGGYAQVRNGVRVLIVPKGNDENKNRPA
jgi:hypothetical protein